MTCVNVYLGLGGNLGNPRENLRKALVLLGDHPKIELVSISQLYRTTPVSLIPQPNFLNAVAKIRTNLSAENLLEYLKNIEYHLGKRPKLKEEPRLIDIDILLYGSEFIDLPHLKIPHPGLKERLFVLLPLSDLEKEIFIPDADFGENWNVFEMIARSQNPHHEQVVLEGNL
jgi:2-amino-4-hydroxy-6-hydroxymethyldihydropteridine diphosphokinase